jgi:ABC-type Fe3+ transport system permease subunit
MAIVYWGMWYFLDINIFGFFAVCFIIIYIVSIIYGFIEFNNTLEIFELSADKTKYYIRRQFQKARNSNIFALLLGLLNAIFGVFVYITEVLENI